MPIWSWSDGSRCPVRQCYMDASVVLRKRSRFTGRDVLRGQPGATIWQIDPTDFALRTGAGTGWQCLLLIFKALLSNFYSILVAFFVLPETENRSLEEIERHFSEKSKSLFDRDIRRLPAGAEDVQWTRWIGDVPVSCSLNHGMTPKKIYKPHLVFLIES